MSTTLAKKESVSRAWYVLDAAGKPLGRTAAKAAVLLRGKHKPTYTPNVDCGDHVIIINADKIQFSGTKWATKELITFSGYPGGQHKITMQNLAKKPHGYERIVRHAVKGMLPKGRLGAKVLRNLYVFEGPEHDKAAQSPKSIDINTLK